MCSGMMCVTRAPPLIFSTVAIQIAGYVSGCSQPEKPGFESRTRRPLVVTMNKTSLTMRWSVDTDQLVVLRAKA